jgi:hypothetical protein
MIKLNIFELNKIKKICEEVDTEHFVLEQDNSSGIGSILTLIYETEIADYPAKVSIEISGVENW